MKFIAVTCLCIVLFSIAAPVSAQQIPSDYQQVLTTLGKQGDFKDQVLKVNIPRNDVQVTVAGVKTPTPFGFGGWIAMTRASDGNQVLMGDLVLLQDEVNPVMSALLNAGLDVTALHNHFFFDTPRIYYMHVHGHGSASDLASKVKPAIALIGAREPAPAATGTSGRAINGTLTSAALAKVVGYDGEQNGGVYKITIARPDIPLKEMGATINARMGLNTWAAFYGSDADAVVAGDIAMLDREVTPVLKSLRGSGIDVVAIHHHMTGTDPQVIFLHYWGKGSAQKLAAAFRAAIDQTGARPHGTSAQR